MPENFSGIVTLKHLTLSTFHFIDRFFCNKNGLIVKNSKKNKGEHAGR